MANILKKIGIGFTLPAATVLFGSVLAASAQTYTVLPGETLSTISRDKLNGSIGWRELCELNLDQIEACDTIYPGVVLRLSDDTNSDVATDEPATSEPEVTAAPVPAEAAQPDTTVVEAETKAPEVTQTETDKVEEEAVFPAGERLDEPYVADLNTLKPVNKSYSVTPSSDGPVLAGYMENARSGGKTQAVYLAFDSQLEASVSSRRIRVEVTANVLSETEFQAAYSTNDVGNSHWRTLKVSPEAPTASFEYQVPPMNEGKGDFIGILPDPNNTGQTLTLTSIVISALE